MEPGGGEGIKPRHGDRFSTFGLTVCIGSSCSRPLDSYMYTHTHTHTPTHNDIYLYIYTRTHTYRYMIYYYAYISFLYHSSCQTSLYFALKKFVYKSTVQYSIYSLWLIVLLYCSTYSIVPRNKYKHNNLCTTLVPVSGKQSMKFF